MFGATENRGVSTVIGFILVFGIIVTSWTVLQAVKVPAENKQTEFDHNEKAQADLLNVRDSMLRSGTTGVQQSTTIQVGADYAQRAITVNLAASSGAIQTRDPSGTGANRIVIENVRALDAETRDYLNRSISVSTKSIVYRPKYSQYSNAPDTVIAGGAGSVINDHAEVNLSIADQILIKDRTITIVAINGSLSKAKSGESATVQLDTDPLSVAERKVTIQGNASGPLTLTIPTQFDDESVWDQSGLEAQPRVTNVDNTTANNVTITLKDGTYTLRMMQIGVGSNTDTPRAEYLTDVDTLDGSVSESSSNTLTLEVRDRFNNPVSGVQISGTLETGSGTLAVVGESDTDSGTGATVDANSSADGKVVFNYTAPDVSSQSPIELSFTMFAAPHTDREQVWVNASVLASGGNNGEGDGSNDELNPGTNGVYVSNVKRPSSTQLEVTLENGGSETATISEMRINFYFHNGDNANKKFTDLLDDADESILSSSGARDMPTNFIDTSGPGDATVSSSGTTKFTFDWNQDLSTNQFFYFTFKYEDGDVGSYLIEVPAT